MNGDVDGLLDLYPEAVEDAANWGIAVIGNNLSVCKNAKVAAKAMVYNDIKEEK